MLWERCLRTSPFRCCRSRLKTLPAAVKATSQKTEILNLQLIDFVFNNKEMLFNNIL